MMKLVQIVIATYIMFIQMQARGSADNISLSQLISRIDSVLLYEVELSYTAEMQFKSFGDADFEVRHFRIFYRRNYDNPLHGFDIAITEKKSSGKALTFMTLDSSLFIISEASRTIHGSPLPSVIETGSYLETLNQYFIFSTYLYPFLYGPKENIDVLDTTAYYILTCRTSDISTRKVYISKFNYLPVKYISTISNAELGSEQIQIVGFDIGEDYNTLPQEAFSVSYFQELGYEYKAYLESSPKTNAPVTVFPKEKLSTLLEYPFVMSHGDTVRLRDMNKEYILLDFWYASCLPCLKALPQLSELAVKYQNSSLGVWGINCMDLHNRSTIAMQFAEKQIDLPVLYGNKDLLSELHIHSFPSYFLIYKNGHIEPISGGIDAVIDFIDQLKISK